MSAEPLESTIALAQAGKQVKAAMTDVRSSIDPFWPDSPQLSAGHLILWPQWRQVPSSEWAKLHFTLNQYSYTTA